MSYLNKQDRKKQITETAKKIVLTEGFNALTVRHLAQTAEISTGQVHHHFGSISELKTSIFLSLVRENLDAEPLQLQNSHFDCLTYMLGFNESAEDLPYLKLWNDVENSIHADLQIKAAYQEAMQLWHRAVLAILENGLNAQEFSFDPKQIDAIAWRLIAASCGFENIVQLEMANLDAQFFFQQLKIMIQHEVL